MRINTQLIILKEVTRIFLIRPFLEYLFFWETIALIYVTHWFLSCKRFAHFYEECNGLYNNHSKVLNS